ncbi:FlgO family outer membrane protein [uncultured Roseobacter sp.]|uniref:FlgO family outer membrane protein n=1 Tax=uncultured Roseobacter sp. TaxID=114847 RepID=UPI00261F2DDA|nr:FlgO family outer membrane protein [uncultured Roseobacter sp.]
MRLISSIFCVLTLIAGSTAYAAESVDEAVEQIAQKFVASQLGGETSQRVAVTSFVSTDKQTTQLTNLLMIALTGKMVSHGNDVFRVIERAQLENALQEIQLSEVDLFNPSSAKEFGNFLGVDALVVGEITPLSDRVRIDSRLIDVETIETLEVASVWVPLTPTVQRQMDTVVKISRSNVMGGAPAPDRRNGIWKGTGICGEASFGIAVSVVVNPDDTLTAMQTYFPLNNGIKIESGVLSMEGTVNEATEEFTLSPNDWMYQPRGHQALGFEGRFDLDREEITARYLQEGCGELRLRKQ